MKFVINETYTRTEIRNIANDPGTNGKWVKGYLEHNEEFYIFSNVGGESYTGVDHGDSWIDEFTFNWNARKVSKIQNPEIQRLISKKYPVHLFTRNANMSKKDLKGAPFTYHGFVVPIHVSGENPVNIIWKTENNIN